MAKKLKYKFRLAGGLHTQYEGKGKNRKLVQYKNGDIVVSDHNLAEIFGKKFKPPNTEPSHVLVDADGEEIPNSSEDAIAKAYEAGRQEVLNNLVKTTEANREMEKEKKKGISPEPEFPFGDDVTDQFPSAAEEDLLVFEKDGFYTVAEKDSPGESVNPASLESLESVQEFIADYAGAGEE